MTVMAKSALCGLLHTVRESGQESRAVPLNVDALPIKAVAHRSRPDPPMVVGVVVGRSLYGECARACMMEAIPSSLREAWHGPFAATWNLTGRCEPGEMR